MTIVPGRLAAGLFGLWLALAGPAADAAAEVAWPPPTDGVLTHDPQLVWGRLANGQRYVILPHATPDDHVSLRLAIDAGSMMEAEDQRGLAHFLEHLAFNGSANLPPGELVRFLQREGLAFGPDTNAATGFDRTVYRLDLPRNDPALLDKALGILAEIQGRLTLDPKEIDAERGVILAEKRERDSAQARFGEAMLAFLLPGTPYELRQPIGDETVIRTAQRPRFADFYATWYVPERAIVVVVGDVDPAAVAKMIEAQFGPLPQPATEPPPPAASPPATTATDALVVLDPALPATLAIAQVLPPDDRPDSLALQRDRVAEYLALTSLNRRLRSKGLEPGAPFVAAMAGTSDMPPVARLALLQLTISGDRWREAMAAVEQELRRALTYGFEQSELDASLAALRQELETAARSAATRESADVADQLTDVVADGDVASSPATDLAVLDALAPQLDAGTVNAALHRAFGGDRVRLVLGGPPELKADRDQVLAAWADSTRNAVVAGPAMAAKTFLYDDFGPAGTVVSRETIDDLGIVRLRFANGVLLDYKRTDFEADTIRVAVRFGSGRIGLPPDKPGLDLLASAAFVGGGLGRQGIADLADILEEHSVSSNLVIAESGILLTGKTTPADLLLQLQLLAAQISDPGFRPEGMDMFRATIAGLYPRLAGEPEGALSLTVTRELHGGDPRYGVAPQAEAQKRTMDELKAWLGPMLRQGPIQVAVVGAFDPDRLVEDVARTFGALPALEAVPYVEGPVLRPLAQTAAAQLGHEGAADQALAAVYWPTTDGNDTRVAQGLDLVADILDDRLLTELREREGATYSPSAGADSSLILPGFGTIGAAVSATPADAPHVLDQIVATAASMRGGGITEDELVRAKEPRLAQARTALQSNDYWLGGVLTGLNRLPQRLDMARRLIADIEGQSLADVQALADRYLDPAQARRYLVLPKSAS
ncbi:MAG: insulinase family protein [Geminicoccaceae bacterium]